MLLVLILSLVCAQWLSHYRLSVSDERFEPDLDNHQRFVQLNTFDLGTLKLQLPTGWKQQAVKDAPAPLGFVNQYDFQLTEPPHNHLHIMQLDVGQVQDPQSVIYAVIRQAVSAHDLSSLSIAHQWARRRGNRMVRRLLAISRSDGNPVLHHLMIWTYDGRNYWAFYATRTEPSLSLDPAKLTNFDKLHTSIALLAQDSRYQLATAQDCADRQLGFDASLTDLYATCDPNSPGMLLLYPEELDGYCVIRAARSMTLDDDESRRILAQQFEATMHRKPADADLQQQALGMTDVWTLHYPAPKDMGMGPEPLARDVHLIHMPNSVSLVVEVVGQVDAVKQANTLLPQVIKPLSNVPDFAKTQRQAIERGNELVAYTSSYLHDIIKTQLNIYRIDIANHPVGYQLEQIKRVKPQLARGQIRVVFPSDTNDATIDHHWQVDWDKQTFTSSTQDHHPDGSVEARSLQMTPQQIVCKADELAYKVKNDVARIPWPVADDDWPVKWMTQKGMLDKWLLIRTTYASAPPVDDWVKLHKTDEGYRLLRRPVHCVDTSVFTLDAQGHFVSLHGYDFEAGPTSTLAMQVQRVDADVVYNQWPTRVTSIEKWIRDHE